MKKFILGFITGGIICATATGFAVEYAVTANPFPVAVNGTETAIEGYNINDNTYFKLRDVADAVGGFNVGFSDNTITIDTDTAAEPTPTPTVKPSNTSAIKADDGNNYTSDGLPTCEVNGQLYVSISSIEDKYDTYNTLFYIGKLGFYDKNKNKILDKIPTNPNDSSLIPVDYYNETLIPLLTKYCV